MKNITLFLIIIIFFLLNKQEKNLPGKGILPSLFTGLGLDNTRTQPERIKGDQPEMDQNDPNTR